MTFREVFESKLVHVGLSDRSIGENVYKESIDEANYAVIVSKIWTEGGNMMVIWSFINRGRKAKDVKVSMGDDA